MTQNIFLNRYIAKIPKKHCPKDLWDNAKEGIEMEIYETRGVVSKIEDEILFIELEDYPQKLVDEVNVKLEQEIQHFQFMKIKLTNWQRNQIVTLYNQSNAPIGKLKEMIEAHDLLSKGEIKDEKEFELSKSQFEFTKHLLSQVKGWPINPASIDLIDKFGIELKEAK